MKVKWLGHASFLITSDKGTRIITDPYTAGGNLKYGEIKEDADVVTISHEHFDHNNVAAVGGKPLVYRGPEATEIKGVKFSGLPTHHDESQGKDRGANTIICMEVDGVRVCHLGDLGHTLPAEAAAQLGEVDVLLAPVGGFYTINAATAGAVISAIRPKVVIPMHFKNDRCAFPISGVEDFLQGRPNAEEINANEAEFTASTLPAATRTIVLKPAL